MLPRGLLSPLSRGERCANVAPSIVTLLGGGGCRSLVVGPRRPSETKGVVVGPSPLR